MNSSTLVATKSNDVLATKRVRKALWLLLQANDYANRINGDRWEFAIDMSQFLRLGLTENDLRFLVQIQYLDHAPEITSLGDRIRHFGPATCPFFTERTCFVLTNVGEIAAAKSIGKRFTQDLPNESAGTFRCRTHFKTAVIPEWDAQYRVLSFDGKTVKQFKWLAINQELILSAFQEECWPKKILDPLSPQPSQVMKRRLSDTIRCLNRGHLNSLIRFRGDGTGEGIFWEPVR